MTSYCPTLPILLIVPLPLTVSHRSFLAWLDKCNIEDFQKLCQIFLSYITLLSHLLILLSHLLIFFQSLYIWMFIYLGLGAFHDLQQLILTLPFLFSVTVLATVVTRNIFTP